MSSDIVLNFSVQQLANVKDKYFPMMHTKALQYLNTVSDQNQYPAARCAMTPGIYMYHHTSSAAIESMKAANREMRAKTAVDPLNACILLLKMECKRFIKQRDLAWSMDAELTPRGKLNMMRFLLTSMRSTLPLLSVTMSSAYITTHSALLHVTVLRYNIVARHF